MILFAMLEKINRNPDITDDEKDRRCKMVMDVWRAEYKDYCKYRKKFAKAKGVKQFVARLKYSGSCIRFMYAYEGREMVADPNDLQRVKNFLAEMGEISIKPEEKIFVEF